MEMVLIKNKGIVKIYQGETQLDGRDYYFIATVQNHAVQDMKVFTLHEDQATIIPVHELEELNEVTEFLKETVSDSIV
jgi:hypothetical protein